MDTQEYKKFLKGEIKVPETWNNHIKDMLDQFNEVLRIKWLPKVISDLVIRFSDKNKIKEIKTSFGELKVVGDFSAKLNTIIKNTKTKCRNTCEFCGTEGTEKVTFKSWVYNCCKNCKK